MERLAKVSDPAYKPPKSFFAKLTAVVALGGSIALGMYEFVLFVIDSHERREMVANWVEASREMYEVEGSAVQAGELLSRAAEVAPQDVDVATLAAYIDGMGVVERLANLDRPFNPDDVAAYGRAMGQAVMLERVDGDSPEWAILRGQLALAAHEPDRAQAFLEKALAIDPGNAFATLRLALVHLARAKDADGDAERSAQLLECRTLLGRAVSLNPRLKWGYFWRATVALETEDRAQEAIAEYRQALAIDPRFANAWAGLGGAYEATQEWDKAEEAYVRALEIRPDLTIPIVGLAYVYGAQDRYEIGLRYARRATELDAGSLEAWTMRGLLARELAGTLDAEEANAEAVDTLLAEAIDAYSKALDLDPRSGDAYIQRSNLNRIAGRLRESGEDARNAVSFAAKDPYAWNALGRFQLAAGLPDKAAETFTKVVELDPAFDTAYLDRAACRRAMGDSAGAFADLELALANATDDFQADILLARGTYRLEDQQVEAALADFVAARDAADDSFEAWINEARTLQRLGRMEECKAAATKAVELRPADPEARGLAGR